LVALNGIHSNVGFCGEHLEHNWRGGCSVNVLDAVLAFMYSSVSIPVLLSCDNLADLRIAVVLEIRQAMYKVVKI
jgi:hypothetical protein